MVRLATVLAAIVVTGASGAGAAPSEPEIALESCTLATSIDALCGSLAVPEDRGRPDGRTIRLRVAVLPAREKPARPDPLVYLSGGPGGSAVAGAAGLRSIFSELNERRDIVLVDQRGTGGSNRLTCPVPHDPLESASAARAYVRACLSRLRADVRQYTTLPAIDDLAEVLLALGYRTVNLYAVSYGATAAQYFLARHPDLVRSAILDGATLLDVPIFERWGPNAERALRAILDRCATSSRCRRAYPRVREEAFEMIAAIRRKPVRVQGTTIDAATAEGTLQTLTRSPEDATQIPWIAHRAKLGDWLPLVFAYDRVRDGAFDSRQLMFWSIVCNEPWARWRPARARAASRGTYLAENVAANTAAVATVCSAMPKVVQPAWTARRVRSDKPVLIVVGGDDPQDPPSSVAGARRTLRNSRTVVVPGAGHTAVQLGCMPRIAQRFVERGSAGGLDTRCATRYAPPPFVIN